MTTRISEKAKRELRRQRALKGWETRRRRVPVFDDTGKAADRAPSAEVREAVKQAESLSFVMPENAPKMAFPFTWIDQDGAIDEAKFDSEVARILQETRIARRAKAQAGFLRRLRRWLLGGRL